MPFSLPSTFFHSLLDCDFSTEFNVQSLLDTGKVVKPVEAYVPSLVSFSEMSSRNRNVFQMFLLHAVEKLSVTGSVGGKKYIII